MNRVGEIIDEVPAAARSASLRMRLEHAVAALASTHCPTLAPPLRVVEADGSLRVGRPFVEGRTLADCLRRGRLSVRETLAVGRAILAALGEMHRLDVFDLAVSPSRVVVDTPVTEATLLFAPSQQFGEPGPAGEAAPDVVAAARYLSPEQAGLIRGTIDHRADLYSAGVVLFECLAGRPPFEAASVGELLRRLVREPAPSLRAIGLAVPRALDGVVQRLLSKDPRDRYQSAEAARADLDAIARALERGESDPEIVIGMLDHRWTLTEPAFVGRREELATLTAALEDARAGRGGLVFLEAESGGGKTRLLDELASRSGQRQAWVLRGQGIEQAALRPFQVLDGVAREVCAAAAEHADLVGRLRREVGDHRETVSAVLPGLVGVLGVDHGVEVGPEAFAETRSVEALATLLDALGAPDRPAVVLVDDSQWADEMSVKLLARWLERGRLGGAPPRHVLVIASFRSEEVRAGHPLRAIEPSLQLVLPPLGAADLRSMAESMAGQLPEEAFELVAQLSGGSPFMASAVLHGLVESGALVGGSAGWRIEPPAMAEMQSSRRAAAYLTRRLRLLPEGSLRLLSAGAILGKEFDFEFAARLANLPSPAAIPALEEARRRHIVWRGAGTDRCALVHDKIREGLLALLDEVERSRLHLAAALALEASASDRRERVFDLAYHFDAAGESSRALPFALAAARQARARNSLESAERQYRIAVRGAGASDDGTRQGIAEGLGEVLMLRGRYEAAERELEAARVLARDDVATATIDGKLGELAFKRGDVNTASARIVRALGLLGESVPRRQWTLWPLLLWEMVVQVLHGLLPSLFVARRSAAGGERTMLAIRLYSRLAYAYWFQRGKAPCGWAHLREMNLAERYPPSAELAQAYSEHAPVCTMLPYFRRGIEYARRSLAIRRQLGDVWGQGQSLHFYGVALYAASRFEECIQRCQEAVRLLERTGDRWEVNVARVHIGFSLYRLGRLREAVEVARFVYDSGVSIGDRQACGFALAVWSTASGGRMPSEPVAAELACATDDIHTLAQLYLAEGIRLLAAGSPGSAAKRLESSWAQVRRHGLRQEYVAPMLPWIATGLRQQAEQIPAWNPMLRRAVTRRARAAARAAVRMAGWYQNNLPHALRERALLEAMRGRRRRAERLLRQSLQVAERRGMRLEHALSRVALGRMGRDLGWPFADQDFVAGEGELLAIGADLGWVAGGVAGAAVTLSLADRFASVLNLGRRIASTLSPAAVYGAVFDAASEILHAESCLVLRAGEVGGELYPVAGDPSLPYSHAIAARAFETERPATLADVGDLEEEILLSGAKSMLCAPIFMRARPAACVFVTHRQIGGLFGDEERRLAQFIAALAGAALENAAGFAEVEALERELRRKYDDLEDQFHHAQTANRLKSEFLATMSHELRTPLNSIIGFAELIYDGKVGPTLPEHREYLGDILTSARHLLQLISDVLDLARVEAGKLRLHPQPVDVGSLIGEVRALLRAQAAEKRIPIDAEIDPELTGVFADPAKLKQILFNYLSNALKFTSEGGRVTVRARREGDDAYRLEVEDTGSGIRREDLGRLFVEFQRLGAGTKSPGVGLGLALTKQLVEAQGGRVGVESEWGKGSIFFTVLPRRVMDQQTVPLPAGERHAG